MHRADGHLDKKSNMSEYTHIYLREKGRPILSLRKYLSSAEEVQGLSEEHITASYAEVDAYNETVLKSFGCTLFCLGTTPSRQLEALPYTEEPRLLSKELLDDVLAFYEEEIRSLNKHIAKGKSQLVDLEKRILQASPDLYDKISLDIEDHKEYLGEDLKSLAYREDIYREFKFAKDIIDEPNNSGYELLYTKY